MIRSILYKNFKFDLFNILIYVPKVGNKIAEKKGNSRLCYEDFLRRVGLGDHRHWGVTCYGITVVKK
jgi:hypothetical protein